MEASSFHRLMHLIDSAFKKLGKTIDPMQVEMIARIVHNCMTQRGRRYHAMPHIFQIAHDASPIEQLAIIFHDVVYIQVDRRIHPKLRAFLKDFPLDMESRHLTPPELKNVKTPDLVAIAYELFDVKHGIVLTPTNGQNEFLSALAAGRILDHFLAPWEIIQIIACIEATIPFRQPTKEGLTPFDLCYNRLDRINQRFHLGQTPDEIRDAVKLAVRVSNRDLMSFGSKDTGAFLSQTWELLLEGNPIFRDPLYTTNQYRTAIQKVEGFFSFLKPSMIFRGFQGEPSKERLQELLTQSLFNLTVGVDYIQAKLIGTAVHEALSILTGGDGPLVLFRGHIPNDGDLKQSLLETHLDHTVPAASLDKKRPVILRLLTEGRASPDGFDFINSPLGAYLYERIEHEIFETIVIKSKDFFAGNVSPMDFLSLFPKPILRSILKATEEVAWSRRAALAELIKEFSKN